MNKKRNYLQTIVILIVTVTFLTGCGTELLEKMGELVPLTPGTTISDQSKWINSDISGLLTEDVTTNIKDDFHTAVNRDWILEQEVSSENTLINTFSIGQKIVDEQLHAIMQGEVAIDENVNLQSHEQVAHNDELIVNFTNTAADWEKRNALGVEPLREYISVISDINSIEDMNAYLLNAQNMNFDQYGLMQCGVSSSFIQKDHHEIQISSTNKLTLEEAGQYKDMGISGLEKMNATNNIAQKTLSRLGYSEEEIKNILTACYRFETKLCSKINSEMSIEDIKKASDNHVTFEELQDMCGTYPLTDLLKKYGKDTVDDYIVFEPDYVKNVAKLYQQKNLEDMKAYFIIHTTIDMLPYLDRSSFDLYRCMKSLQFDVEKPKEETMTEVELIETYFTKEFLMNVLQESYVAHYCTLEEKTELKNLITDIVKYYEKMIQNEDWLSEETKAKAIEKLNHISIRVICPDEMDDYSGLVFAKEDNLVDMVYRIKQFESNQNLSTLEKEFSRDDWNMSAIPTTAVNAYYLSSENSVNILAGMLADEEIYNMDMSYEEKLGKIGAIVGHEITHAFDESGSKYDKEGLYENWWTDEDRENFAKRVDKMKKYYAALTPLINGSTQYRTDVSTEATADMGGVKCMLGLAKETEDFDYDLFFQSFAQFWRMKDTFITETLYLNDVHPLNYLRTNVTLQQFDEFIDTYDLEPGDGMYLAPDQRIAIW